MALAAAKKARQYEMELEKARLAVVDANHQAVIHNVEQFLLTCNPVQFTHIPQPRLVMARSAIAPAEAEEEIPGHMRKLQPQPGAFARQRCGTRRLVWELYSKTSRPLQGSLALKVFS